ncbi:TetR/AcrR family transcriptional regulator [Planomonospora sp. ID82291]|uniref:TetR/AcrR family transcriptional regulator n=1 Tax=Planomonospora sp. ID82291 TaxID=2738136 RepID=UPI0018C3B4B7|nr:WHG domain-containing protein [Planomonospora sp. ID82291]MBG0814592.1 WHG domain-containing protein [Planomonospora sp. ID82291]
MTERAYHHGNLREALVDAGLRLLDEGGVEAVGIRSAARLVGVSHAAPARCFPTATSFLAAVAAVGYGRLAAALTEAVDAAEDTLSAFRAVGLAYVGFARREPNTFRMLTHPSLADKSRHPDLLEASNRAFDVLREAVLRAQDDGHVAPASPAALALTAWSTVHGISALIVDDQLAAKGYTGDPDDLADEVLATLFLGMRPVPGPPA